MTEKILNDIRNLILGLMIGLTFVLHQVCIDKDKTITLVQKSSSAQVNNLPLIKDLTK